MTSASIESFLDVLRKSAVVDAPRLDPYLEQLRASQPNLEDSRILSSLMVRDGLLTTFQAEQILAGKWKGFHLGKYVLLERLGSGGMGTVYLAEHKNMKRRVALKVLPPSKASDPSSRERLYREAKAVAALDHPNIVQAYDVDQDGDVHFLVMEYVDGTNLNDLVRAHGPLEFSRAADYVRQAAEGLEHASKVGLVHRDIKPGNLLVNRAGTIKILDMGLARFFHDQQDNLTAKYDEGILGTVDYLSPEQALDSHNVDIRADIYSLGATFYFLLSGRSPVPPGTVTQKLLWHQIRQPKPIKALRADTPDGLVQVLQRMMTKDRNQRYQTPADVAQALRTPGNGPVAPPTEEELKRPSRGESRPDSSGRSTPPPGSGEARRGGGSAVSPYTDPVTPPDTMRRKSAGAGATLVTPAGPRSDSALKGGSKTALPKDKTPSGKAITAPALAPLPSKPAARIGELLWAKRKLIGTGIMCLFLLGIIIFSVVFILQTADTGVKEIGESFPTGPTAPQQAQPPPKPLGVLFKGGPFGTLPATANKNDYPKAFDGNTGTFFEAAAPNGVYLGVDLGPNNDRKLLRVRYFPRAGQGQKMVGGKFQGSNLSSDSGYFDLHPITAAPKDAWTEAAVNNPHTYRFLRYLAPNNSSGNVAEIEFYVDDKGPPAGNGSGLKADYFDNKDFTNHKFTRVDPTVNFNWGQNAPDPALGVDNYTVRWTGQVVPRHGETYSFHTESAGGIKLWVDGKLVIDNWKEHAKKEDTGSVDLTKVKGKRTDLKLEFYDKAKAALVKLSWSSKSQAKEVVPQSQLFPAPFVSNPWKSQDIGTVGVAGSALDTGAGKAFTVKGSGKDIWDKADAFHFLHQPLNGDGEIVARVAAIQNMDPWAKVGVMIRETLTPQAKHASMLMTPSKGASFLRRPVAGDLSKEVGGAKGAATVTEPVPPYWVKLVRKGSTFTAYKSKDGTAWEQVGTEAIEMPAKVFAGLVVCSHNNAILNSSVFDNVAVTPTPAKAP